MGRPPAVEKKRDAQSACLDLLDKDPPARARRSRSKDKNNTQTTHATYDLPHLPKELRPEHVRTQTQTQDLTKTNTQTQTTVRTTGGASQRTGLSDSRLTQETAAETSNRWAMPNDAWAGAGGFVTGGFGFSETTLAANENDLRKELGEQLVTDEDKAACVVDPYLRVALLAKRGFDETSEGEGGASPSARREASEKNQAPEDRNPPEKTFPKPPETETEKEPRDAAPFANVFVYFQPDVLKKRREIFAEKLAKLGATVVQGDHDITTTTHVVTSDVQWMESFGKRFGQSTNPKSKPKNTTNSQSVPIDINKLVAVCADWCVKCLSKQTLVSTDGYPPGAAQGPPLVGKGNGKGKGQDADCDHSEEAKNTASSTPARRRLVLEAAAEAQARIAADASEFAANPDPGTNRAAVMTANETAEKARHLARVAFQEATAAGATPLWVALPDSESQQRPFLGRVKTKLACQNPVNALALPGPVANPMTRRLIADRARGKKGRHSDGSDGIARNSEPEDSDGDARLDDDDDDDGGLFPKPEENKPPKMLNQKLIEPLLELADIYDTVLAGADKYRAKNHKEVVAALRDLDFEVTKIEQLVKHPESKVPLTSAFDNKNSSIRDKIQALLTTGKLEKLDILKQDKRVAALLKLGKIWGVGPESARKLYQRGFDSIEKLQTQVLLEDAREAAGESVDVKTGRVLTPNQRIGLKHYGEFELKMPREEAAAIGQICREAVDEVCGPRRCRVTLAGSFRRGKPFCGDVDVLIAPWHEFLQDASQLSEEEIETMESEDRLRERDVSAECRADGRMGDRAGGTSTALDYTSTALEYNSTAAVQLSAAAEVPKALVPVPKKSASPKRRYVDRLDDILPNVLAVIKKRGLITDDLGKGEGRSYMGVARVPMDVPLACEGDGPGGGSGGTPEGTPVLLPSRAPSSARGEHENDASPACPNKSENPARKFRRIDIKVYAPEEYPFALLYFTGSGYFNRSMRWWSKKKFNEMSLGDKGFRLVSGAAESKVTHTKPFLEERDIFEYLKLAYVAPEDRCV